jgi:hypothetical protein
VLNEVCRKIQEGERQQHRRRLCVHSFHSNVKKEIQGGIVLFCCVSNAVPGIYAVEGDGFIFESSIQTFFFIHEMRLALAFVVCLLILGAADAGRLRFQEASSPAAQSVLNWSTNLIQNPTFSLTTGWGGANFAYEGTVAGPSFSRPEDLAINLKFYYRLCSECGPNRQWRLCGLNE